MKKWAIALLIACFCLSMSITLSSCGSGEVDTSASDSGGKIDYNDPNIVYDSNPENFKFSYDGRGGYILQEYKGSSEFIEIPSFYSGKNGDYPVTTIGYKALFYAKNDNFDGYDPDKVRLKGIKIPDSITEIQEWAFGYLIDLEEIVIPGSVKSIGKSAFNGCQSLIRMTVPFLGHTADGTTNTHFGYIFASDSWNKNGEYVPSTLKELTITKTRIIYEGDLAYLRSVKKLSLPSTLTNIEKHGLWYMQSLEELVIPDSVVFMGDSCLNGCSSLKDLTIPFTGHGLLDYENSHIGYIFGAEEYKKNAQYMPSTLEKVVLTKQFKLTSGAFYGVKSLKSITIPSTIMSVADDAFQGCTSLEFAEKDGIYYLASVENPYMYAMRADKDITTANVDSECVAIMSDTFSNCYDLETVNLGEKITKIGKNAFYRCTNLTNIDIPDGVTEIGESAFYGDKNLVSVNINASSNISKIGASAFNQCEKLESIVIPAGITSIGKYAFYGCTNLSEVEIVNFDKYLSVSLENLYSSPFAHATKLVVGGSETDTLTIPDGVMTIHENAFAFINCVSEIVIPSSVNFICQRAFYEIGENVSLDIPVGEWKYYQTNNTIENGLAFPEGTLADSASIKKALGTTYSPYYWRK